MWVALPSHQIKAINLKLFQSIAICINNIVSHSNSLLSFGTFFLHYEISTVYHLHELSIDIFQGMVFHHFMLDPKFIHEFRFVHWTFFPRLTQQNYSNSNSRSSWAHYYSIVTDAEYQRFYIGWVTGFVNINVNQVYLPTDIHLVKSLHPFNVSGMWLRYHMNIAIRINVKYFIPRTSSQSKLNSRTIAVQPDFTIYLILKRVLFTVLLKYTNFTTNCNFMTHT